MHRKLIIITATLGALAVAMGAFGAHALEATLQSQGYLDTYETAVRYHIYHVLASLIVLLAPFKNSRWPIRISLAFLSGILIFSGSLYILSISGIRWLGAITPIGGVLFIIGWLMIIPLAKER